MKKISICLLLVSYSFLSFSQATTHHLIFPENGGWSMINENQELSFQIKTTFNGPVKFAMEGAEGLNIQFDTLGNFLWKPGHDLVDRVSGTKEFPIIFEAVFPDGERDKAAINFVVHHVNRPPVVEELPVFYVKQASRNTYQIPAEYVYDPDEDPIVFRSLQSQMPEGASLSSQGLFTWSPSRSQFSMLKNNPITIEFIVQDQPHKAERKGKLRIAQTQLDLPPEILIVPTDSVFSIKEDETLNLKIYVSDPNGDDNIRTVGFVSSDTRIPTTTLKENTSVQYEFTWTPGYHFVDDVKQFLDADVTIFALDKTNNRTQKKITIKVADTENLIEKDALQYTKYRNNLLSAYMLIAQLDDNQKKLNEEYKRARQGKKKRSVLNASLGAATGLSPLTLDPNDAKIVSGLGGTTVLTLGTLEATEVIGRSKESIMEKIRLGIEIRNRVQSQGDEFARKYTMKSARRTPEFEKDVDKLRAAMNDQKLVLLELSAYSRNRGKVDNKDIRKVFIDFSDE